MLHIEAQCSAVTDVLPARVFHRNMLRRSPYPHLDGSVAQTPDSDTDRGRKRVLCSVRIIVYLIATALQHFYTGLPVALLALPSPTLPKMLVSLTVGKVDAGVAVLLTEDKRLVCMSSGVRAMLM